MPFARPQADRAKCTVKWKSNSMVTVLDLYIPNKERACWFGYVVSPAAQRVSRLWCLWLLCGTSTIDVFFWSRAPWKHSDWNHSQGNQGVKRSKRQKKLLRSRREREAEEAKKMSPSFFSSFLSGVCLQKKKMLKCVTVAKNEAVTRICQLFTYFLFITPRG